MENPGDPLGHLVAATETERRHPVEPEEKPTSFARDQLLVLALVVGLLLLACAAFRWL